MMHKRAALKVPLDVADKQTLNELNPRRGMKRITIPSRLVRSFAARDEAVQSTILRE